MKAAGCVTHVTECDRIFAPCKQAWGASYLVSLAGDIGHFDNEIQMEKLVQATKRMDIKVIPFVTDMKCCQKSLSWIF